MYIHAAHFKINKKEIKKYIKDSRMWGLEARKYKGFIACLTAERANKACEYVSVYVWKDKKSCDKFMNELHDELVSKSFAKVKTKDYLHLNVLQEIK